MTTNRIQRARFAVGIAMALILLSLGASIVTVQPLEAARPVEDALANHVVFLPVVTRPWPNVSGTYLTVSSGLVNDCAVTPTLPGPIDVPVTQTGVNLTMTFPIGDSVGQIDGDSGAFTVQQSLPVHPQACPGGCKRVTTGTFQRQTTPITFSAKTTFYVYRTDGVTVLCSYNFDQNGTRK